MGTSNPKVSAYVPQLIKERLTQFREERSLSESQAVIAILAEYFQMEQSIDRSGKAGQIGGVTLSRMEALEERLTDFAALVERRLQQLGEEIEKISGLSVVHQVSKEPFDKLKVKQDSSLPNELPAEPLNQKDKKDENLEVLQEANNSVIPSEPVDELPVNEDGKQQGSSIEAPEVAERTGELTSNPQSEPLEEKANHGQIPLVLGVEESEEESIRIDIVLLARRVGITAGSVNNKRSKLTGEEFVEWTTVKDIDGIGWRAVKEGKRVYYEPAAALENEPLSRLLAWIRKNRS